MAEKFYSNGTDICKIAEPKTSNSTFGQYYIGEHLWPGGSDTVNITLDKYLINGKPFVAVKNGHLPKHSFLCSLSTAGSYTLNRTDQSLTIGSSTFSPEDFSCNTIPNEILALVVGGGGGGGGNGIYQDADKNYRTTPGGAGGGGGTAFGCIKLTNHPTCTINVGAGGALGSTYTSTNSVGSGGAGKNGSDSSIISSRTNISILTGNGGKGGSPGNGTGGGYGAGAGGAGGGGSYNTNICRKGGTRNGGTGNSYTKLTSANTTAGTLTLSTGTGQSVATMVPARNYNGTFNAWSVPCTLIWNNGNTIYETTGLFLDITDLPYNTDQLPVDSKNAYYCGGMSYGGGTQPKVKSATLYSVSLPDSTSPVEGLNLVFTPDTGWEGGGGGGGDCKSAGAKGYVSFYY